MICILGDLHLSSRKPYILKACQEFLEWFRNWEKNREGNNLILAGDLVDSHINGGTVIDLLEKLIDYSKFDDIYVCVGNHDKKKADGYDQLAYEFYRNKPNVHVYEKAEEVIIEKKKVLFLPYFLGKNENGRTMNEEYHHKHYRKTYDLIVGHFCAKDSSFSGSVDCVEDLENLKAKKVCLGHIHTRSIDPNKYIGSVYAGRKNENDKTRSAWYLENDEWKEERLPIFTEFITLSYPEDLPKTNAIVPVYTILNCKDVATAKQKYGDIYLRRTTIDAVDIGYKKKELDFEFENIRNIDVKKLFEDFVKSFDVPLSREVEAECRKIIG